VFFLTDEDDCSAKKTELFDPKRTDLGPLASFRCTEFGLVCDEKDLRQAGQKHHCKPGGDWLVPIEDYVRFYRGLRPPGQVILAAIAGPPEPVEVVTWPSDTPRLLPSANCFEGGALPAVRINALLSAFPPRLFCSKCVIDYQSFLAQLGATILSRLDLHCLPALFDSSAAPGLQPDCAIEEVSGSRRTVVPACSTKSGPCQPCPCWRARPRSECAAGSGQALELARAGQAPSSGTIRARCRSAL